ncbi:MAG: Uma2 family endonuclease [Myxococcales bacterium]|nr:Uma2 family endonuclease [Myxococcales bacterium]
MAPADPALRPSTRPEAYLAAERTSEAKHELWSGEVFAMAGASYAHNKIVTNLARELSGRLRDRQCDVLPSDMKVFVPTKSGFVYPDVSVVCGEPRFHDDQRDVLLNPLLVVEVLSDTTERFDRGDKFAGYRGIESIRQVLLVSQDQRRVEVFTRAGPRWILDDVTGSDVARLEALDCDLPLDEVYLKVFAEPMPAAES